MHAYKKAFIELNVKLPTKIIFWVLKKNLTLCKISSVHNAWFKKMRFKYVTSYLNSQNTPFASKQ